MFQPLTARAAGVVLVICCCSRLLAEEAPDLAQLAGKTISIQLSSGKGLAEVEVLAVVAGTEPGSIKSLNVKVNEQGKKQLVGAATVVEIFEGSQPLDVTYDKKTRSLKHDAAKRAARLKHEQEVNERLAAQRERLWPKLTEEEQAEWLAKHKEYLKEVQTGMGLPMNLVETKYYLFLTDMPAGEVGPYLVYLDAMYDQLCGAFGIPGGQNIWAGKCIVVAFKAEASFHQFEEKFMQNPGAQAQGICHSSSDGKVVIAVWKGDHESFFANVLVHETAHGFVHRYKSTVHIPSWVNEGIADWVAAAVVKTDKEVGRRQREAAGRVRESGTLGGNFFQDEQNIDAWQYGVASSLVDLMLRGGPKYRKFFDNMKEGMTSTEALQDAYGVSEPQLAAIYGQSIGVPNLRP
jgi:hypothetical protein